MRAQALEENIRQDHDAKDASIQDEWGKSDATETSHEEVNADERDERPDHVNLAMGEIDHAEDAVDHGVAEGDEGVDAAHGQAVLELLNPEVRVFKIESHSLPSIARRLPPERFHRSGGRRFCFLSPSPALLSTGHADPERYSGEKSTSMYSPFSTME